MYVRKATWWVLTVTPVMLLAGGAATLRAAESDSAKSTIAFRLAKWKSMHFDDAELAKKHLATVKQLGCDARQESHGGHIDVTYRCEGWKPLVVGSDELAHQWQSWLQKSGFETLHGHAAAHGETHSEAAHQYAHQEEVAYRLARKVNKHFNSSDEASQFATLLQALGCEVTKGSHGNHIDVSFHCAGWMHAEFASHDVAHAWEKWLKEIGFETQHSH